MYIQAVDGYLYKDAYIKGDEFFIVCMGEEKPMITLKKTSDKKRARTKAFKILKGLKIKTKIEKKDYETVDKCVAYEFTIDSPIPVPDTHSGRIEYPSDNVKFLAWEMKFPIHDVEHLLDGTEYPAILINFLAGKTFFHPVSNDILKSIRIKLRNQIKKNNPEVKNGVVTVKKLDIKTLY